MKKNQILIAHQKEGIDRTKKVPLAAKKCPQGTRGFGTLFWVVDHPLCDVWMNAKYPDRCTSFWQGKYLKIGPAFE